MAEKVYSLAISARAILDLHSLNNEGGEGNQTQTRMVDIVAEDGRLYNVNAISGDMFKHIQAEHLYNLAKGNLPLCAACARFDANRISADDEFINATEEETDARVIELMLQQCAIDDLEGNLITAGGRSTPRKSVAEFGWVVGVPVDEQGNELTTSNNYFHVKYANERGAAKRTEDASEAKREGNLGQAIFYRPTNSGVYAVVSSYEISRIGYNDISQEYVVDDAARTARYKALLESVLYTFVQPNGAMRNTQLPHMVAFKGVISYTTQVIPAPTISPLNGEYVAQIQGVQEALNGLRADAVKTKLFANLAEFSNAMREIIQDTEPFKVEV